MPTVVQSTVIAAPIERVWAILRDFNAHQDWHPAIASSELEAAGRPDQVGCVRRFRLQDGSELRECLLALSDRDHALTYCILDSDVPLLNYVASLRLRSVTDGNRTFWEWRSRFGTPPGREQELSQLIAREVFQGGFDALRRWLEAERPTPSTSRSVASIAGGASLRCGALVLDRFGSPDCMSWREVEVPPPGPGEVRIQHLAVGVNYIDVYCRTGYFQLAQPPAVLGMEAAGTVIDIGPGVDTVQAGDRVAYACPPVGAYAECRVIGAELVVPLPEDVDELTAAAAMLKGMTAEFLLHRVHRVGEGDTILVHAAAGGVGSLLCQWGRALGAVVIGTVGSEAKLETARASGCSHPLLYREEDFVARVMALTDGRGANVVYDAVGRDTFLQSFQALAVRGHLVSYGQASGALEPVDLGAFAARSATVSRPNYAHYTSTAREVRTISDRLFGALRRGIVRVRTDQRYPLREAARAHLDLEQRRTSGSILLLP